MSEWESPSGRHWFNLTWQNDWPEWMPWNKGQFNWRNFRLAYLHFEDDGLTAGWDIDVILFGVGFSLRYTDQMMFETTEVAARIHEARTELREPLDEWDDDS